MAKRNPISEAWAARPIEMLEIPAYRVLSLSAHRALSRIEVEFAHHGGQDNGKLPVTYDDFERYGVRRRSIGPALLELEVLGFIVITEHGKMAKAAEYRRSNKFLLASRPKQKGIEVADRWRQFKTTKGAEAAVKAARQTADKARRPERQKEKAASGETAPTIYISGKGERREVRAAAETPPATDAQTLAAIATISALADSAGAPTKASAAPPLPEPRDRPAAPPHAEVPSSMITAEPMIDGVPMTAAVYSITGRQEPVVVVDDSCPIRRMRFANVA